MKFTDYGMVCFSEETRAKTNEKEGLVLSAKKASDRVKITVFLIILCVLSTAAYSACCFNPYASLTDIICQDSILTSEQTCCYISYQVGTVYNQQEGPTSYSDCVANFWNPNAESCLELDECQDVCCIGIPNTCEDVIQVVCSTDDELTGHRYTKINPGVTCSQLLECQLKCCCKGTENLGEMEEAKCAVQQGTTPIASGGKSCSEVCGSYQPPCGYQQCESKNNVNCDCVGGVNSNGKFCCSSSQIIPRTYVFDTQEACNAASALCAAKVTYSVSGHVKSASVALAGVNVTDGKSIVVTGSNGYYIITGLNAGSHTISVNKKNYNNNIVTSRTTTIVNDDALNFDFDLVYTGYCGDRIVQTGEQCDPSDDITCNRECQLIEVCDYDTICDFGETWQTCPKDCRKPTVCGDGTKDAGEECDEGVNGGATCLPTCRNRTTPCIPGTYNATGCKPETVTITFNDGPRTFDCPTWDKCNTNGRWTGVCEKINERCPTACNGTNSIHDLGGVFCTSEKPFCTKETLSPDIVTQPGRVCCKGETDAVCTAQISLCEYRRCDAKNPIGCKCGAGMTNASNPFCCSQTGKVYKNQDECYQKSICKKNCLTGSNDPVVLNSTNLPCDCGGLQTQPGVCCVDGTYVTDIGGCIGHEIAFINIQGTVTDSSTNLPIQGAIVYVIGKISVDGYQELVSRSAETNSNGFYMIERVPKTNYTIAAEKRSGYFSSTATILDSEITQILTKDFTLKPLPSFSVRGYVFDAETAAAIKGADVIAKDLGKSNLSKDDGSYVIANIIQGMHLFGAQKTGYYSDTNYLNLIGNAQNFNFSLTMSNCFLDKYAYIRTRPYLDPSIYPFMSGRTSAGILTVNSAGHSISKLGLIVRWTSVCAANKFNVYRCEGGAEACSANDMKGWVLAGTAGGRTTRFEDNLLQYNKTYCYKVSAEFSNPFFAEIFSSNVICNYSGDTECYLYGTEYCDGTKKITCGTDMKKNETDYSANDKTCGFDTNLHKLGAVSKSNCTECNRPLGLFSKIMREVGYAFFGEFAWPIIKTQCNMLPVCYEDYTNISVDKYYSCDNVKSCYDYKSKGACTNSGINDPAFKSNNRCLQRNCTWEPDIRYEELGFGVCRELTTDELCKGDRDCDRTTDDIDPDSDNDLSLDIYDYYYDYDKKTGMDILQNCSRCSYDQSKNPVYMKCDEKRCGLYGECYFDINGNCVNRKDSGCNVYTNKYDCEKTENFSIDKTDNSVIRFSDDYFRYGVCEWEEGLQGAGKCIKDVDAFAEAGMQGGVDCGANNNCWLDMAPAETKPTVLGRYSSITLDSAKIPFTILDVFTNTYANSETYVCVENVSLSGGCSAADANNDGIPDNYTSITNGISNTIAKNLLKKLYGTEFNFSSYAYRVSFFSKNKGSSAALSSDNLEPVKSIVFNYDRDPPRFVEDSYIHSMNGNYSEIDGEAIKRYYKSNPNISYYLQSYMVAGDEFRTDLFINFTLTEPALCKITLRKQGEPAADNLLINDENWTRRNYGPDYFRYYSNLPDGLYYFNYECYDSVLNKVKETIPINIDSDQTMTILWPAAGDVISNSGRITLQLLTNSDLDCVWTDDPAMLSNPDKKTIFSTAKNILKTTFTLPLQLAEGGGYLQTADYDVGTGSKYVEIRALCQTKLFGIRDEFFTFTVDQSAPDVIINKIPRESNWLNNWYNDLAVDMQCIDPEIPGGMNAGCTELYYCVGADCSKQDAAQRYTAGDPLEQTITLDGDVFKELCYYGVDSKGNTGQPKCDTLKFDSVAPMLDGISLPDYIGPYENLQISGTINDYLSGVGLYGRIFRNIDNDWVFDEQIGAAREPIFLENFTFKANVTFGPSAKINKIEVLRFRISDDGRSYYSLYADPNEDKISIGKTLNEAETIILTGDCTLSTTGAGYQFELDVSSNLDSVVISLSVDGNSVFSSQQDTHFGDLAKGKLAIMKPVGRSGLKIIDRNITQVRIGGYTSGVDSVWYNDAGGNKRTLALNGSIVSGEVDIPGGESQLTIYVNDTAGNEVHKEFPVKKDVYGPNIYAEVNNSQKQEIGNYNYPDRFSQYGTNITVYVLANDDKYSKLISMIYAVIYNQAGDLVTGGFHDAAYAAYTLSFTIEGLGVGNYSLNVTAYDIYGNENISSQTFEVRDTIPPTFNITMDFPSGDFNYTLRGYTYHVNITASEPLNDSVPILTYYWNNPTRKTDDVVMDMSKIGDRTYTGNLTIKNEPRYNNFAGIATFEVKNIYDINGNLGTLILYGKTFNIDTKGATAPRIRFPSTTDIIYTNQNKQLITGFEGELKAGVNIELDTLDVPTSPKFQAAWNKTQTTRTYAQGELRTTGTAEAAASIGDKTLTITANDLISAGNYAKFGTSDTDTGLYYRILSNTGILNTGYSILTVDKQLQSAVASQLAFDVYDTQYPQGWFGADVGLMTGYNYIYAFGYDEHGIKGEPAVQGKTNPWQLTVVYDPFAPQITPIKPYHPEGRLVTPVKNSAVIAEVYENLSLDLTLINMTVNYTDYTKIPAVTTTANYKCSEQGSSFSCSPETGPLLNVTYNPGEDELGMGLYVITVNAGDAAGNKAAEEWEFEIDPNVPYPPIISIIGGVNYNEKAYTRSRNPVINITFIHDGERKVNITSIALAGQDVFSKVARAADTNNSFLLDLAGTDLIDGEYTLTLKAIKEINETDWSKEGGPYNIIFTVDNTPPKISVDITTPTMIKNPSFRVTTDDPSNCSYHTDEYANEKYMPAIGLQFDSRLEKHTLKIKELTGVKYSKTQHIMHVLGNHTIDISCTNILGMGNESEKKFNLMFPKIDKVFYKARDTIIIFLKLDESGLDVKGNFSLFSSSNLPTIYMKTATLSGTTYTLSYTLPATLDIGSGQYEIPVIIKRGTAEIDRTSALVYYHNETWTFEDDVQSAVSCYNSNNPGVYFGEVFCDQSADISLSLKLHKGLGAEENCNDNVDNDGDGLTDCNDPDCGGILYKCRNIKNIVSAVNISDPRNVKQLKLAGGTTVFYLNSVKPGQTFKARFVQENIQSKSSQFAVKLIPASWGVTQQNAVIEDSNNLLTKSVPESGDQIQAGPAIYTGNLNLLMQFPAGQIGTYTLEFLRSVNDAAGIAQIQSSMNVANDALSEEKDYVDANYYGCYDLVDNDLDSADWAWKNRNNNIESNAVGANGTDCWDPGCDNQPARKSDGAKCEYLYERTCDDNFDNDLDDDNGQPDYVDTGGIDCRDSDCDTKQGGTTSTLKCEYRRELSCSDGFNNDAYQQKDCDLAATSDNPTLQEAYDAAEYDCQESCRQQSSITTESGQNCNDNKDNDYDYFLPTAADKSQYLIGARNPNGGIDCRFNNPDPDCHNERFTDDSGRTGKCELGNEQTCNDGFDNDQDSNYQTSAGWKEADYNEYFGEGKYFKGADCDDYSCATNEACPKTENITPKWCFDGADNDLDNTKDCLDKDCDKVELGGKKCEFGKELSCTDGFDNDGDGLIDQYDPDCRAGSCYPFPAEENITIDSCSDSLDQDFSEGADCSDPDCNGKPCGAASKCISGICKSVIDEVCDNNKDDDYDGSYDCYDDDCFGETGCTTELSAGMCNANTDYDKDGKTGCSDEDCMNSISCKGAETAQFTAVKSGVKVTYNKYVRIGEKLRVRFEKAGLSNAALLLGVGDATNPISQITVPTTSTYTSVGTGFTKTVNSNGVTAQNTSFTGNLDTYIEITVTKTLFETETLGYTIQAGTDIDLGAIGKLFISESTVPVLPTTYYINKVQNGYKFWVKPTDTGTGIDRCEFTKGTETVAANNCSYIYTALATGDKIKVKAFDRAGNYAEKEYTLTASATSTTSAIPSVFPISYTVSAYNQPGENISFSVRFQGATTGACTAKIYDEELTEKISRNYNLASGLCAGEISISTLNNGSYSLQVSYGAIKTEHKQFFKCKYTQFPDEGIFSEVASQSHCMDSCQINKVVGEYHVCDNGQDSYCVVGCSPSDPDCGDGDSCKAGDGCKSGCSPSDPDCDGHTCKAGDGCLANCVPSDPDCKGHSCDNGQDGYCVVGCSPSDPDCGDGDSCGAGDGCKSGCSPSDPDCDGATCREGDACLANCMPPDMDCGTGDLFIKILEPYNNTVVYNPRINLTGVTINKPNLPIDIYVNTLSESQYQAQVKSGGMFSAYAILLSKQDNFITVSTSDGGLRARDTINVKFDGVDVKTNIDVEGLPLNIKDIIITMSVVGSNEQIDLKNTEVKFYKEKENQEIGLSFEYVGNNKIIATPTTSYKFTAGTYRVEVLPVMKSGRYGAGELYRFSYCPDGSQVVYTSELISKTREQKFEARGHITPVPTSSTFVFIRADGTKRVKELEYDKQGNFIINIPDLIIKTTNQAQELNSYYITTTLNDVKCDDIRRSLMYDATFEGLEEKPYIKGEKEKAYGVSATTATSMQQEQTAQQTESYPLYLIENDIGEIKYNFSTRENEPITEVQGNTGVRYVAYYTDTNQTTTRKDQEIMVSVSKYVTAYKIQDTVVYEAEEIENCYRDPISQTKYIYRTIEGGNGVIWQSNNYIIVIDSTYTQENTLTQEIIDEYLNKYPSSLSLT